MSFFARLRNMDPVVWKDISGIASSIKSVQQKKYGYLGPEVINDALSAAQEKLLAGLRNGADYSFENLDEVASFIHVCATRAIVDYIRNKEAVGHHIPGELETSPDFVKAEYGNFLREPAPEKRLDNLIRAVAHGWYDSRMIGCGILASAESPEHARENLSGMFSLALRLAQEQKEKKARNRNPILAPHENVVEPGVQGPAELTMDDDLADKALSSFVGELENEQRCFFFDCILGEIRISNYLSWKNQRKLYDEKNLLLEKLRDHLKTAGIMPDTVFRETLLKAFSRLAEREHRKKAGSAV